MIKMADKLLAIYDGWKNDLVGLEGEKLELARDRALKCSTCAFNVNNVCSSAVCDIINGEKICGCGCNTSKKTKSFKGGNKCPKNLW
jgi:hypothetical protein